MKKKGMLAASSLILATSLLFLGCGNQNTNDPAAVNSSKKSEVEVTDPLKAYSGTTLNVLLKEGYNITVIQENIESFEKATGIDVKLDIYDESTANQKFVLDATAKTGAYDVTALSFWHFPEYEKNGWLEPIDDYMANKVSTEWYHKEDLPQSALDTYSMDGKHYAMPHTIISGMTYFRKDIFEKHNLQQPKTTDDMLALAPKLKELEPDMIPITGRGAPNFASLGTYLGWAWGYGAQLLDENNKPHANSPEMVKALTDYVNLVKNYGPVDEASLDYVKAGEKFQSGNAIMMYDTSGWGSILEDPKQSKVSGKIGYSIINGPAGRPLQWIYMDGLAISSSSKKKDAAWLFLQWRMSRETTMVELTEQARTDVPNLYVLNSPEYEKFAEERKITDYTKLLPDSWKMADIKYWPFVPEFAEIGDTFMTEISAAIAGQKDVPTALNNAQKAIEDILKRAGY
jgi:ABC-type glycerol-3-phosphate transport system substrate-binding protein